MPKPFDCTLNIRDLFIHDNFGPRCTRHVLAVCILWCQLYGGRARADPGSIEVGAKLAPSLDTFSGTREQGENAHKLGASVGASLHYGIFGPLGIEMDFLYATRGTDVQLGNRTVGSFYFTYLEVPVLARLAWRLPWLAGDGQRSPLSVHILAGGAVSRLLGAVREDGSGTQELPRGAVRSSDVSIIGGVGLTWDVTSRLAASFEVRYDAGLYNAFPDAMDGRETKNQAIVFTFGVGYTLNDGDSDGVASFGDQCPARDEDWNGFQDDDGCPDADDDKDGIRGEVDACPREAEDMNQYEDEDGCPDGHEDEDKDGIADKDDKCVNQAFPYNKGLDNDKRGCPPKFDLVHVERGRLELTPPLEFEFGEVKLTDQHRLVLDQVIVLLRDYYPDMRLSIEGHTDSKLGKKGEKGLEEMSDKRANAVREYLVAGDSKLENRLETKAHGKDNPMALETSDGQQLANRRVELVILANPEP